MRNIPPSNIDTYLLTPQFNPEDEKLAKKEIVASLIRIFMPRTRDLTYFHLIFPNVRKKSGMVKLKFRLEYFSIIVVGVLLFGSFGNSISRSTWKDFSTSNIDNYKARHSEPLQGSMNEQINGIKKENNIYYAIQSSGIITEDSDNFLEGIMDNLTLNDNGYLSLEEVLVDSWKDAMISPLGRHSSSMVYNSHNQKVVVFGGYDGSSHVADTWVYDLPSNIWFQMNPSTAPGVRDGHSMVYDSNSDRVILFGGNNASSRCADTWVYDLSTNTWANKNPLTKPDARNLYSMVYDCNSDSVILFGGHNGTSPLADTWIYDLATNTWSQMNPSTKPDARYGHSMVYDSISAKVILFGGYNGSFRLADTWAYNPTANIWSQMNPSTKPDARDAHSMVYDSFSGKVILFGGQNGSSRLADTWNYSLTADNWTQMNPSTKPSARIGHSMVYDSTSTKVILFGGYDYTLHLSDTWAYDLPTNTWIANSAKPSGRYHHSMVYDSFSAKVILFGGYNGGYLADTWVYDPPTRTWTQRIPANPPSARDSHSMVYDSTSTKVILFGGYNGGYLADTWIYDLLTNTWTQRIPANPPSARHSHSMVYDSISAKVILFGGYNASGRCADTWIYDLPTNNWTQMNPLNPPSARDSHSMVYDSTSAKVILFGGTSGSDDTWVYDLQTNTWTQMNPPVKPSARYSHSMVYDSDSAKVVLFGGTWSNDETWLYDLLTNTWTQKIPKNTPNGRTYHSMVYDSTFGKVILFGGWCSSGNLDDTWIYPIFPYYQKGRYKSKLTCFGNIYNITGRITWNSLTRPLNTELKIQVGLSNTTLDEDFRYTGYSTSDFAFGGFAQYLRYRVIFESDLNQFFSPLLKKITIYYSLEKPEPTVQITNPQNNSTIEGLINISARANSPNGIEKVCFNIGGFFFSWDYSSPYGYSWNSSTSENGYVSVMVVAVSTLGKENVDSIQLLVDNPVDLAPVISVPSTPLSLTATAGDNFVTLSWSAPNDDGGSSITRYNVYRGTLSGEYMFVGITTIESFNDTLILGETTYYYVVTARNVIGESDFSNEVSATPTGVTIPKSGSFPNLLFVLVILGTLVLVTRKTKKT